MAEYVCLTVISQQGESEASFKSRLVAFWSQVLRSLPDDYEKVYAEAKQFEREDDHITRRYMVEPEALSVLEPQLREHGLEQEVVDIDDVYSKAEASTSEWFQIPH